jgi:phosphatidylserine/phosphatidylglycerophosphate/cardiolipin synthase-like enzyme
VQRDGDHIPFVTSGSYPIRDGNRVTPLVDGEPAFRRICEAVEAARKSVWATIAFHHPDFEMPDGRGSLFDVLDAAVARGLDVRVLFWRHRKFAEIRPDVHFAGTEKDRAMLRARGSRFLARWDQAHGAYCQHQKSWVVDAGEPTEVGFVGGINLNPNSCVPVGHPFREAGTTHDVYVEIQGPAATDVHHNFVQRWNEASDRDEPDGSWPEGGVDDPLPFPRVASAPVGEVPVQIQRTVRRERYRDGRPAPGAAPFDIHAGEFSVVDQYRQALDAARRSIYAEDQALASPEVVERLGAALQRGVEVVLVVPRAGNDEVIAGRKDPKNAAYFESLAALGDHDHFTLAAIAGSLPGGGHQNIYVHSKLALVDDVWGTIGSTNVANRSFYGDTELNASFWHRPTVAALRRDLLLEHLAVDTSDRDDVEALRLFARIARENAARHARGEKLVGLAFAIDPAAYAG